MALGRPLGAKLFLEGKEVPFLGATITAAVHQASIAYVDLTPHSSIMNIKPRTLVEIFVRDYMDTGGSGKAAFPYVLAWRGEVFGYNFGKTPASRSFTLQCIDVSSYWDNALAYYFNPDQSLGAAGLAKSGDAQEKVDVKKLKLRVLQVSMTNATYFRTKIEEVTDKGGDFLDALVQIYKEITNINPFFTAAEERNRIIQQIVLHSSGQLKELVAEEEKLKWFIGVAKRTSGYTTLRGVIQDLMGMIFHDSVSVPFPAAVESDISGKSLRTTDSKNKTIGTFVFKPNLYMVPPPACNIFFPDEYSNFQFNRNFFQEPTRLIYMPELPARLGGGSASVYLNHVYEPDSFRRYMIEEEGDWADFRGEDDTSIPKEGDGSDPGQFGDEEKDANYKKMNSGRKREWQFLTNEEYMKGITLSRESMMPATSSFRHSLDDFKDRKTQFTERIAKYLFYKKRFEKRSLQITSHLKLSVVPGFPVLILDDSDADQNVIAYCSSVTHRITAAEGGYTNVHLSYARSVNEQSTSSTFGAQFLVPPWFDKVIFGEVTQPPGSDKAPVEVATQGVTPVAGDGLSNFYKSILGGKGSQALTDMFKNEKVLLGAVRKLIAEYREHKAKSTKDVQSYIAKVTARDYVKMKDSFDFFGASTTTKDVESSSWIEFTGDIFKRTGKSDQNAITQRGNVVKNYRDILKQKRGFRG